MFFCLRSYSSLSSKKVALRVHIVDDDENYYDDYYLDEVQRRKMRDMDMAHEGDWHISVREIVAFHAGEKKVSNLVCFCRRRRSRTA